MKHYYRVLEPGYMKGVYREPGGKHDPVVLDEALKVVPSWLKKQKGPGAPAPKKTGRAPMPDAIKKVKNIKDVAIGKKTPVKRAPAKKAAAKKTPAKKGPVKKPKPDLEVI